MDEAFIKKVLPHSVEAEQAVIGSMLMDNEAIVTASELLTGEEFYQHGYKALYEAILALFNEGKPADLVTLQEKLKENDVPPEVCGLDFIATTIQSVPTSANVRHYATIVAEKALLRRMIRVTEGISNTCYLDKHPLEEVFSEAETQMFQLLQQRGGKESESIRETVLEALDNIEAAAKNKGSITGIATGFYDLDYKTAGMQRSDLILVAARPSMGKSVFGLNIAEHAAMRLHIPTVFFSLEMSQLQLVNRMLSMLARVEAQTIRTGNLNDDEWLRVMEAAREIGESCLVIDDTPGISISQLRSKCRKYKLEKGIGLIVVDYLQLMSGGKRVESRQQEISEISRSLKALARELDCPVVALAQLSRAVEQRPDKRPLLSDLRESGAIEQDADVVMFIYRDEYYNKDNEENKGLAEIIIGKQRNGPTGTVTLKSQLEYSRFANLQR